MRLIHFGRDIEVTTLYDGHAAIMITPEDGLWCRFRIDCAAQLDLIAQRGNSDTGGGNFWCICKRRKVWKIDELVLAADLVTQNSVLSLQVLTAYIDSSCGLHRHTITIVCITGYMLHVRSNIVYDCNHMS